MIETQQNNLVKYIFLIAVFVLCLFVLIIRPTFAQVSSPVTSPAATPTTGDKDIKFPIGDLGGCADIGSCMKYCDDPVNNAKCVEYAKEKGFYRDDKVQTGGKDLIDKAKEKLGCDSVESCLAACDKPDNLDKCSQFAKDNNIEGGYVADPVDTKYLDKAKEKLGCDSATSCATFCGDVANAAKCSSFANEVGLQGGTETVGPGGCRSDATCVPLCSDPNYFESCKGYSGANAGFTGPGGCDSQVNCRTYCEENSDECRSYAPGSNGRYVPIACPSGEVFGPGGACTVQSKTGEADACVGAGKFWNGSGCDSQAPDGIYPRAPSAYFQPRTDMGGCNTPGGCYDWCRENAGKCGGFNANGPRPPDTYVPYVYYTPGTEVKFEARKDQGGCDSPGKCYDYCRDNADKCQGFDPKSPRPADNFAPGTYYTPPTNYAYYTPPTTNFYVTPVYYTPPAGSNYTSPSYYTPGMYSTPSYYTPPSGSNYITPTYYTPGSNYYTPTGSYPTPNYPTPQYYTPPEWSNYSTPSYYSPPNYTTPTYYTPPAGSTYTSPSYNTPAAYNTPSYYSPACYNCQYTTPTYYTPPAGSNYTTPSYVSPSYSYPSPTGSYSYPTPSNYSYPSPNSTSYTYPTPGTGGYYYPSPSGGSSYTYPSPSTAGYYSPTAGPYYTPPAGSSYTSPSYYSPGTGYSYPTPSGAYGYPTPSGTYYTPASYSYPTPSGYSYPTPSGSYSYPAPSSYSYPSPSYGTPSYGTPSYGSPSYNTPSYETPSYSSPSYNTPSTNAGRVAGEATGPIQTIINFFASLFK